MSGKFTAAERETLASRLRARRQVLRAELREKLENHDDPALIGLRNRMAETDDWVVADLETALDVAEVSRDATELREVDAALARLAEGTYGTCLECGQPIPPARLAVTPSASRCIACQERLEAALKRPGRL